MREAIAGTGSISHTQAGQGLGVADIQELFDPKHQCHNQL